MGTGVQQRLHRSSFGHDEALSVTGSGSFQSKGCRAKFAGSFCVGLQALFIFKVGFCDVNK